MVIIKAASIFSTYVVSDKRYYLNTINIKVVSALFKLYNLPYSDDQRLELF